MSTFFILHHTIPSEIKINNENKKVSGVWGISLFVPNEFDEIDIVFDENIENLEMYNYTFFAMKIKNIVFPSKLKSLKICVAAFAGASIETFDLSNYVNLESLDIEYCGFYSCQQLKGVKLPQRVTSLKIGEKVFSESSIETLDLSNCANLESLDIGNGAFHSCKQLKEVKLPQSVTSLKIGTEAFLKSSIETFDLSNCANLESLDIGYAALHSCKQLKGVRLPKSLTSLKISGTAFLETSIETFDLSNCANLESLDIGYAAFHSCQQLKEVLFSESLTSLKIDELAFWETSIETFDLSNCANLESLDIEDSAFSSCRELKRVLLPKSLTSLKIGEEAFHGDIKMQTIDLSKLLN